MIYYLVFFVLAIFTILSPKLNSNSKHRLEIVAIVAVVAFQGLRWERGTDWTSYYEYFNHSIEPPYYYEYGWWLLNNYVLKYTDSFNVRLTIESTLIFLLNLRFAQYIGMRNKNAIIMSLFAGCIFPVRFELASAIVLNSYQYIVEKNLKRFFLVVILASTIHIAALLIIPFFFVYRKELSLKQMLGFYMLSIIVGFMPTLVLPIFEGLNNILNIASADQFLGDKIDGYLYGGLSDMYKRPVISIILSFVNGAIFIWMFYQFRIYLYGDSSFKAMLNNTAKGCNTNKIKETFLESKKKYTILSNLYLFGICFNRLISMTVPYMARIGIMACAAGGFILIFGIEHRFKKNSVYIFSIYVIYKFLSFYGILYGQYSKLFLPYNSIIS